MAGYLRGDTYLIGTVENRHRRPLTPRDCRVPAQQLSRYAGEVACPAGGRWGDNLRTSGQVDSGVRARRCIRRPGWVMWARGRAGEVERWRHTCAVTSSSPPSRRPDRRLLQRFDRLTQPPTPTAASSPAETPSCPLLLSTKPSTPETSSYMQLCSSGAPPCCLTPSLPSSRCSHCRSTVACGTATPPNYSPGAPAAGTGDPPGPAATHICGLHGAPRVGGSRYPAGTPQQGAAAVTWALCAPRRDMHLVPIALPRL